MVVTEDVVVTTEALDEVVMVGPSMYELCEPSFLDEVLYFIL